jgi:hypothetical protein
MSEEQSLTQVSGLVLNKKTGRVELVKQQVPSEFFQTFNKRRSHKQKVYNKNKGMVITIRHNYWEPISIKSCR